jgi:hypothetical protein
VEGNIVSETNAEGQSPLNEGTLPDQDRESLIDPNLDPDKEDKETEEEEEEEIEADGPVREDPEPLDH